MRICHTPGTRSTQNLQRADGRPRKSSDDEAARSLHYLAGMKGAHPLSVASRDYADLTHQVLAILRPTIERHADPAVRLALAAIERHADLLAVETRRAVGGLMDVELVQLSIAESRDAWSVLRSGYAFAERIPVVMVERLGALDAAVRRQFPHVMEFVRAGFDEPNPG